MRVRARVRVNSPPAPARFGFGFGLGLGLRFGLAAHLLLHGEGHRRRLALGDGVGICQQVPKLRVDLVRVGVGLWG